MEVDPIKKLLSYPDNHYPMAVEVDVMISKTYWKVINLGQQGEKLIKNSILDYVVFSLLEDNFKI